jgi:CRISPR-associated protein Cas1
MRRMLNTLYVTAEAAWLRKDGANVVVEVEGEERGRAPLHMLEGLVSFGRAGASPALLAACAEAGITVSHLTPEGRFLARVEGARTGNVLLRRAQFRASEDTARATVIVRGIVAAKTANQRAVIRRALRDHADTTPGPACERLEAAERRLTDVARRTLVAGDVAGLRGLEGEAALTYFSVFNDLVRVDDPGLGFAGRSRRPPLDRMNALLSFLYAMLGHDCRSALETHGLDPQVGFLHADRPGRASLALDLMEELRPVLADRLALSLVNRRQLLAEDFLVEETGGVRLTDEARRRVLVAWQERKRDELRHPFLGETAPLGLVAHIQALLLGVATGDDGERAGAGSGGAHPGAAAGAPPARRPGRLSGLRVEIGFGWSDADADRL